MNIEVFIQLNEIRRPDLWQQQLSQEIDEGKVVPPGIADTDAQPRSP